MSYGRKGKQPRVYLWRLTIDVGGRAVVCWKIGITGGHPEERLDAWSGWLAQAGLLSVEVVRALAGEAAAEAANGWRVEIVSVSPVLRWEEAVALEKDLHRRYAGQSLGNEFFRDHRDFGEELLGAYRSPQGALELVP